MRRFGIGMLLGVLACGGAAEDGAPPPAIPQSSEATTTAALTASAMTGRPWVVILGTSLTAGLGVSPDEAYPAMMQRLADSAGFAVEIVAAGLSGETSAGALRRVEWLLQERPALLVIETGANDGLRGVDPDSTAANLRAIIARVRGRYADLPIVLAQMEAPPNLGVAYTSRFHAIYGEVAQATGVALLPFFLEGVAGVPSLNQPDGIHPTPAGAERAGWTMWRSLAPLVALAVASSR